MKFFPSFYYWCAFVIANFICFVSCDGRVVKALDLKSNGIFPRRFEPYSQRYVGFSFFTYLFFSSANFCFNAVGCDGRVVKAFDSKSNGIFPRRFESYSQRAFMGIGNSGHVYRSQISLFHVNDNNAQNLTTMGIEPTIFRFEVGRLIHWATRP